jgi:mRNA interferase RelE/StbE
MRYRVIFSNSAKKQIRNIPEPHRSKIARHIESLKTEPRPRGASNVSGLKDGYRVRAGDYRIIYCIRDEELIVLVVRIGSRGDVYKNL